MGCWKAARHATTSNATLVISHDPRVSYATALLLKRRRFRGTHLAFSFNYDVLPSVKKRAIHAKGFRHIDRFTVYSTMERKLYSESFNIPLEKIDFIYWGVRPPQIDPPDSALENGDYICAIGGNSRDYATLLTAMSHLPHIPLVLVARPRNVHGIRIPENVTLRTNIPFGNAMNILAHSRFMVLPLTGSSVPCGHVTIVNAMYLRKAFIATESEGIEDYAMREKNCLTIPANDVSSMCSTIEKLWGEPAHCESLGNNGQCFANTHCTEPRVQAYLEQILAHAT